MMSAGLVIVAVQYLLWSFPSYYELLDCFINCILRSVDAHSALSHAPIKDKHQNAASVHGK